MIYALPTSDENVGTFNSILNRARVWTLSLSRPVGSTLLEDPPQFAQVKKLVMWICIAYLHHIRQKAIKSGRTGEFESKSVKQKSILFWRSHSLDFWYFKN